MGIIERIYKYLKSKGISAYEFERKCDLANGYLNSRKTGTRGIGSEILEKIYRQYRDLNLIWVITGEGEMLIENTTYPNAYPTAYPNQNGDRLGEGQKGEDTMMELLKQQNATLLAANADKDKIIAFLEGELKGGKGSKKK